MDDRTMESLHAEQLAARLDAAAAHLRRLADVAAQAAESARGGVGRGGAHPTYAHIAARVREDVAWEMANMHLDGLITDAQQADEYRIKGEIDGR